MRGTCDNDRDRPHATRRRLRYLGLAPGATDDDGKPPNLADVLNEKLDRLMDELGHSGGPQ